MRFLNLRGPNGAGKTTLLRCMARDPACMTIPVFQPVWTEPKDGFKPGDPDIAHKIGKPKGRPIVATVTPSGLALLGDYTPAATGTTAGCDRISRQDDIKAALVAAAELPDVRLVAFEGIIVSTIFQPWLDWERANGGMIWAFLDTPLATCLQRIQDRNGGEPIKEDLVANKFHTISRLHQKAKSAGVNTVSIHWETALKDFKAVIEPCLKRQVFRRVTGQDIYEARDIIDARNFIAGQTAPYEYGIRP